MMADIPTSLPADIGSSQRPWPGKFSTHSDAESDAAAFATALDREWRSASIRILEPSGADLRPVEVAEPKRGRVILGLFDALRATYQASPYSWPSEIPTVFTFNSANGEWRSSPTVIPSENAWTVELVFPDDSVGTAWPSTEPDRTDSEGNPLDLDVGIRLLEPITQREFKSIEDMIGLLAQIAQDDALDDEAQRMIMDLIRHLESERNDSAPGETQRWKIVGAFRSIGRSLSGVPMKVYWTTKLVMLINEIGWTQLATEYEHFFRELIEAAT